MEGQSNRLRESEIEGRRNTEGEKEMGMEGYKGTERERSKDGE